MCVKIRPERREESACDNINKYKIYLIIKILIIIITYKLSFIYECKCSCCLTRQYKFFFILTRLFTFGIDYLDLFYLFIKILLLLTFFDYFDFIVILFVLMLFDLFLSAFPFALFYLFSGTGRDVLSFCVSLIRYGYNPKGGFFR